MAKKKTREVEYYRLWEDHTWDTDFIDIPTDTPDDKLNDAVIKAAQKIDWMKELPVIVGFYCSQEDELEETDEAAIKAT